MKSDVQIAQETKMLPIESIAESIGVSQDDIESYGKYKAKISLSVLDKAKDKKDGKLILVTAINPTPAGEGKTTTNVGLSMALNKIGKKTITALREPSLGPCFGIKGGAAGGGYSQVVPMDDINLHFTGDFHAVTSAHNLLAAMLDNHIHQGNELDIDVRSIVWKRVMDMNERALRQIVTGLGPRANGVVRDSGFDITTSSEIMAALCLATSLENLKNRMGGIIVAYNYKGKPVTADDLNAAGAMTLLLKDAIKPNLVQTVENTPALIHCGPFANIAHGCNSVLATKIALKLSDYVVTEAGFGADLGAEKFFNIKCLMAGLSPDCTVIVATARALKYHGGVPVAELGGENLAAIKKGAANIERHLDNLKKFGVPAVVAINKFPTDTDAEIELIKEICAEKGADAVLSDVWARGGDGGIELAEAVVKVCDTKKSQYKPLYDVELDIEQKINIIAQEVYGASGVDFTSAAKAQIDSITRLNLHKMPVCMAKTQYSFSDNPALLGAPEGYRITVREVKPSTGAGFIVALTGEIMTMPGLPKVPAANGMDIKEDGTIIGLS